MKLYDKCSACRKKKLFVRIRKYTPKSIGQEITSNNQLCGKCFRAIKKLNI